MAVITNYPQSNRDLLSLIENVNNEKTLLGIEKGRFVVLPRSYFSSIFTLILSLFRLTPTVDKGAIMNALRERIQPLSVCSSKEDRELFEAISTLSQRLYKTSSPLESVIREKNITLLENDSKTSTQEEVDSEYILSDSPEFLPLSGAPIAEDVTYKAASSEEAYRNFLDSFGPIDTFPQEDQ